MKLQWEAKPIWQKCQTRHQFQIKKKQKKPENTQKTFIIILIVTEKHNKEKKITKGYNGNKIKICP